MEIYLKDGHSVRKYITFDGKLRQRDVFIIWLIHNFQGSPATSSCGFDESELRRIHN